MLSDCTDDLVNPVPLLYGIPNNQGIRLEKKKISPCLSKKEVEEGLLESLMPEYVPSLQEESSMA